MRYFFLVLQLVFFLNCLTSEEINWDEWEIFQAFDNNINLRDQPSINGKVIKKIHFGEILIARKADTVSNNQLETINGQTGKWINVSLFMERKITGHTFSPFYKRIEFGRKKQEFVIRPKVTFPPYVDEHESAIIDNNMFKRQGGLLKIRAFNYKIDLIDDLTENWGKFRISRLVYYNKDDQIIIISETRYESQHYYIVDLKTGTDIYSASCYYLKYGSRILVYGNWSEMTGDTFVRVVDTKEDTSISQNYGYNYVINNIGIVDGKFVVSYSFGLNERYIDGKMHF